MRFVFIDSRITDISNIISAFTPDTHHYVFDWHTSIFQDFKNILAQQQQYETVGIIQHNFYESTYKLLFNASNSIVKNVAEEDSSLTTWTEYIELLQWIKTNCNTSYIDLFACDIWIDPDWKYIIQTIASQYDISIRASINITGEGGDFILESDNFNTIGIYFTEDILQYKYAFSATPSKMYMIAGSVSTSTAQTAPFPFNRSTNFPGTAYVTDSTADGYIAFYLFLNGLYIVSTVKSGMAYGINMAVNTVYKLITYSTTGNPKITTGGVVDSPAPYSSATHQMFSIRFNSLKDLYVYSIAPSANPTLLCIPFTTRVNGFTGQTMTAGFVHAVYTFNSLQGVYAFAFQPNTDHIFLCFTNIAFVGSMSYSRANDTSKYGLTVKYYGSRVINYSDFVSRIHTDAISCCFDANSNLYYTNGTSIGVYTANSSGSVILNYSLNNSSNGPFFISLTGISRSYSLEIDASNNLFVGNINGALNVITPASTTATVFGTVINSYTMGYNSSTKTLTPTVYRFFAGGSVGSENVVVSSANSNISTHAFALDKRTNKSLFFPNAHGIKTIVNLPSPPSYCIVSSPSTPNIQISGLLGNTENNYNSGVPLSYNYYSLDGTNYTQVDGTLDTVTFSTSVYGQNTVYLISNNIIGNSSVYSTSVFVQTPYVIGTAPTITSITNGGQSSFSVFFTPGTGGYPEPTTYYYSINGGAYTNANSTTSPIVINGINSDVSYNITLIANNLGGNTVASNVGVGFIPYPCFLEGTKILRFNPESYQEEYIAIEKLRKGDLILTSESGYKAIHCIGYRTLYRPKNDPNPSNRIYKFTKLNCPTIFEPLYITGEHCTLHPQLTNEKRTQVKEHMGDVYITEESYRIPAHMDDRAEPYDREDTPVTIWHFALENENVAHNYGVYANGLLVESCAIESFMKKSGMISLE